jgi:hypothetical protein
MADATRGGFKGPMKKATEWRPIQVFIKATRDFAA